MTGIVVVGGGGFGREVIEIIGATGHAVEGVVDDSPSAELASLVGRAGSRLVGTLDWLLTQPAEPTVVIAIGDAMARRTIVRRLEPVAPVYPVLIHPDATVGRDVRLGAGTVIAPGARLSTNIDIGRHVHIDQNATVGHDTTIGDFVRLNPQACISGFVTVGASALVGASATVLQGLEVGPQAIVGAGAVVTRSVSPGLTVMGVPAR
ncbi:acetyltransferase [Phycicoccus ginsengisoli]